MTCYKCNAKDAPIPILGGKYRLCFACETKRKNGDFVKGLD